MRLLFMTTFLALATSAHAADGALQADLELLAAKRIYFAHQSVGANILEGLGQLWREAGVPVRIVQTARAAELPAGTFGHFFVPENGEPLKKLANFEAALGSGSKADIALIKFCYVDVDGTTDVKALFERYQA